MNKKELAEIKKSFSEGCGFFTLNRILYAYCDAEKHIKYTESKSFAIMPEDESAVVMETLKKALSGSLGKNLNEYRFPNESYEEGGAQNVLYAAVKGKLEDEEANKAFIDRIVENTDYASAYTIISGHCTYSILVKDKNDEIIGEGDSEYNFVITALCPVNTGDDGLFYDDETQTIAKKSNTEMIIAKAPQDGFLYPVFSDRSPDVNSVMYYTRSPKKPNLSIIEDVLDCKFDFTPQGEKERFRAVLTDVCRDELDYTVITKVNDSIKEVIDQNKNETEPPVIDCSRMRTILSDAGVSDDKLQALDAVYRDTVGDGALKASNLVENKTVLSVPEITVNISKEATDKVRTSVIQGKKCLIIDLDDPSVLVNGIETSFETAEKEPAQSEAVTV
ncbi:MAG: DUF4317 domain-containing protein [Oscillospiraceae bacterium]|nr:DUF4317 domain-containing protein [Oscillospiraceae bacterium]MDY3792821.1 DUF4317 domain-containing protein [Oscillospiraceae bacterium]MDY6208919.1 DUF4317 domain-containing protein [Oscillospiraceae bacterium]